MKTKTLKSILLFCILHSAFCIYSNAQIVYTDVNPDLIFNSGYYNLDLNTDGINDYKFQSFGTTNPCHFQTQGVFGSKGVSVSSFNSSHRILHDSIGYPLRIDSADIIGSTQLYWNGSTYSTLKLCSKYSCVANTNCSGLWNSIGYLGLKLYSGPGIYYYGWIRLSLNVYVGWGAAASFTIKDYAYNSTPNQPILAGETSCATPTVNLTQSGPLSFCGGDSVVLTANGTVYQYQWKKNNVNIAGATAKKYVAKTAGDYKCKVTNSCGSKTSGTRTVTVPCRTAALSLINNYKQKSEMKTNSRFLSNISSTRNENNIVSRLSNDLPFEVEWSKTIEGNNTERNDYIGKTIAPASGGGYLSLANTVSDNLPGYHGDVDILATRVNSTGNILWQKCFGGSGDDEVHSVIKTMDGGFLVMGYTSSEDGDVSSFNHGNYDLWLLKINDAGNVQWEKCFGGSDVEFYASGLQNADGSYMVASNTLSNDGDVSGNHGDFDVWLIKIDATGNFLWQKCYGGSGADYVDGLGIIKTQGVGYALNCDSYSYLEDGDLADAGFHQPVHPSTDDDAWLVKIDNVGNIQWSKCFGGEGSDWFRYLTQFSNGDFIGTGGTIGSGNSGDMPGSYGDYDWWVGRISSTGNLLSSRHYGGSLQETINNQALELANGEIILPSGTNSNDFDVSGNPSAKALWIMKIDPDGNMINDNIIGNAGYNQMGGTVLNFDGSLTINAMVDTTNLSGYPEDVDENADVWMLQLNPVAISNHKAQLYNSTTGITDDICTEANSLKLNLRITIPPGFISWQGITVKWYKNNYLISTQNAGEAGYTGVYGKTIYKSLAVPKFFGLGDGTYKAKISYSYKQGLFNNYHQKNFNSNNIHIDFNNNCGAKLADENSSSENINGLSLTIFPNPLSNSTTISFSLNEPQNVSLKILDVNGRLIETLAENIFEKGAHQIEWNTEKVNAGIYFLKMQAGEFLKTEKLVVTM